MAVSRIQSLLQKLTEMAAADPKGAIDLDLMLDYTRVVYADLLEQRSKIKAPAASKPASPPAAMPVSEPTLAEMAAAMGEGEDEEDLEGALRPLTVMKTMEYEAPREEPQTEQQAASIFPPPYRGDVRKMIGINDKYQILSELFGNDKVAYEEAMDRINESDNEAVAMKWLEERLWVTEEHSDAAQSFYDVVHRYFAGR